MMVPGSPSLSLKNAFQEPIEVRKIFSIERHAVIQFMKYLLKNKSALKSGILVPNFMCHEVNTAFRSEGFPVHFYPLEIDFSIDLEKLNATYQQNEKQIGFVFLSHLYGKKIKNLSALVAWAKENSLISLEDGAHLPFSGFQETIQTDAKFYTLRKVYGLPRGAVALVSEKHAPFYEAVQKIKAENLSNAETLKWIIRDLIKQLVVASGMTLSRDYVDLSNDPMPPFNRLSGLLQKLFLTVNAEQANRLRWTRYREYFAHFQTNPELLETLGTPIQYQENEDVPFQFILYLSKTISLQETVNALLKNGIGVVKGLALDPEVTRSLPTTHPWIHHIALPLHQGISSQQVEYVLNTLKKISR